MASMTGCGFKVMQALSKYLRGRLFMVRLSTGKSFRILSRFIVGSSVWKIFLFY